MAENEITSGSGSLSAGAEMEAQYKADDYHYSLSWSEEDQTFIGRVAEFPSMSAHGETLQDALVEIHTAVEGALEDLRQNQERIPMPFSKRTYSGSILLRMPKNLHRQIAIEAQQQGVSLNRWINAKLEVPLR